MIKNMQQCEIVNNDQTNAQQGEIAIANYQKMTRVDKVRWQIVKKRARGPKL